MEEVAFTGTVARDVLAFSRLMKQVCGGEEGDQGLVQADGNQIKKLPDQVIIGQTKYWRSVMILGKQHGVLVDIDKEAAGVLATGYEKDGLGEPSAGGAE